LRFEYLFSKVVGDEEKRYFSGVINLEYSTVLDFKKRVIDLLFLLYSNEIFGISGKAIMFEDLFLSV
jgi:hypothetical protein